MAKRSVRKSRHIVTIDKPATPEETARVFNMTRERVAHVEALVDEATKPKVPRKLVLVLDDQDERHDGFRRMHKNLPVTLKHAYKVGEAKELLDAIVFDVAYLDHDLAELGYYSEGTGMDVARYIISMAPERRPKFVWVHSWNESRALAMESELRAAGVPCRWKAYKAPPLD